MTILEKQFYNESILLEQIADIENRILDEEIGGSTTPYNALGEHVEGCVDSCVTYCICNADRALQGGLL